MMDGASAELVRNIINERSAKGKESVGRQVVEIGRPPLRVTVPVKECEGTPSPKNGTVMRLLPTGPSGAKPVGWLGHAMSPSHVTPPDSRLHAGVGTGVGIGE